MRNPTDRAMKQALILLLFPIVFLIIMVAWAFLDPPRGLGDPVEESPRGLLDMETMELRVESMIL